MSVGRVVRVGLRVVAAAAGVVAVGVAINQVLNGGVWSWWWLVIAVVLAVAAEGVNQWLARHDDPPVPVKALAGRHVKTVVSGGVSGMVATGGESATITQTQNKLLPPPTAVHRVEAAGGLVNLPPSAGGEFVGRSGELARLAAALETDGPVVVVVVHGLGGIGKSTLAARYAAGRTEVSRPVWWITADAPDAVQAGLAGLATALQVEETAWLELEVLAERAMVWLATHTGWLLVLDNVTDPAHITPLLGRARSGRIIVTSRLGQGWHRLGAKMIRLDVLDPRDATVLLHHLAYPDTETPATFEGWVGAVELVTELGYLPLAIEQAGAYLHQAALTPAAYLHLLRTQPAVMYDRTAEGTTNEEAEAAGGQSRRTIAQIWRLTLDHLHTRSPLTGHLLRVMAWLAPEAIPRTLLAPLAEPADLADALGLLAAYNMITLTSHTITVHRLVQALARTPDPRHPGDSGDPHRQPSDIHTARDHTTQLLNQARPTTAGDPAEWPTWRTLLPHIDALTNHTPPATATTVTAHLLNQTGLFLEGQGAIGRAIAYCQHALTAYERVLGADHPDTLTSRNDLAGAYRSAGDLGRAIALFEQTLTDRERVLGADHPDTLNSRNDLAYAYQAAGDLGRAIALFEQTLTDSVRVLGADHPITKTVRGNLEVARK